MDGDRLLRGALDVAQAISLGEPQWTLRLVTWLADELGADTVGLACWHRHDMSEVSSVNVGGPPLSAQEQQAWSEQALDYPFFAELLLRGGTAAVRTSDLVPSMREFRSSRLYAELLAPRGAVHQANFGLLDQDGDLAIVGLYRRHRDFDAPELAVLEQARGLLASACAYRRTADRLERRLSAVRTAAPRGLTAREQEVMALVASGATNEALARRLGISPRTVRKHVESVFSKLGVHSRAAAVAVWIADGGRPAAPWHGHGGDLGPGRD